MIRVKICGMTREEDVEGAVTAGADAVGFLVGFPSSPRNLTVRRARVLARCVPPLVDAVLVAPVDLVRRELDEVRTIGPDAVQLYGDDSGAATIRKATGAEVIKAFQVRPDTVGDVSRGATGYDAVLTDTYSGSRMGGTGEVSDWGLCSRIRKAVAPTPLILSGGLNASNVAEAIRRVRPFAVDVSSGVESSPGVKSFKKMAGFVRAAKDVS